MSVEKRVDVWAQPCVGSFMRKLPEVQRLFEQSGSGHLFKAANEDPSFKVTPEQMLTLMDEAGIEKVCLSAWCRPEGWVMTNDEISEYVNFNHRRFIGVGTVNLLDPYAATQEIERCVRDLKFKAVRVLGWLWNLPPNDKHYYPIYVKCIELDIPFCCQVGHTGPLMPSEPGRPIPYIDEIALKFPKLRIVGGHIGYPWTDEMIALAWKHENVYIDTSAYDPKYYPPQLVHFMKTYGKYKVMFGTNYPQLSLQQCANNVKLLKLPKEAEENFLWRTAYKVFKLDQQTSKL